MQARARNRARPRTHEHPAPRSRRPLSSSPSDQQHRDRRHEIDDERDILLDEPEPGHGLSVSPAKKAAIARGRAESCQPACTFRSTTCSGGPFGLQEDSGPDGRVTRDDRLYARPLRGNGPPAADVPYRPGLVRRGDGERLLGSSRRARRVCLGRPHLSRCAAIDVWGLTMEPTATTSSSTATSPTRTPARRRASGKARSDSAR